MKNCFNWKKKFQLTILDTINSDLLLEAKAKRVW